jgi:hypothetical protein
MGATRRRGAGFRVRGQAVGRIGPHRMPVRDVERARVSQPMFVTGKYQGRHRETRGREARVPETQTPETRAPETRGRARFGLRMVAAIACAAMLTAWPAPRYN